MRVRIADIDFVCACAYRHGQGTTIRFLASCESLPPVTAHKTREGTSAHVFASGSANTHMRARARTDARTHLPQTRARQLLGVPLCARAHTQKGPQTRKMPPCTRKEMENPTRTDQAVARLQVAVDDVRQMQKLHCLGNLRNTYKTQILRYERLPLLSAQ